MLLTLGRLHEMKRVLETVAAVAATGCEHVHLAVVGPEQTITVEQVHAAGTQHGLGRRLYVPGPPTGRPRRNGFMLVTGSFLCHGGRILATVRSRR